jgi:hypothetical protein
MMDRFFEFYEAELADLPSRSPQLEAEIAIAGTNAITDRAVRLCHEIVAHIEELERHLGLRPSQD